MGSSSHEYSLNTQELFILTDALEGHKRSIEKQLSKAMKEGNEVAIHLLLQDRQQAIDLHDMFNEPILQDADEWKLAEQGIYPDTDDHDGDGDLVTSEDDEDDWLN